MNTTAAATSGSVLGIPRRVIQNSYMIRSLVVRDIQSRYVGSLLGLFWSVVHPLTQIAIYYFLFAVVFKVRLGPEYGGTHYAVWLITGLLPWMFFAEIVGRASGSVTGYANLIKKTVFPSELLPLSHAVAALVNHLIAFAILVAAIVLMGGALPARGFLVFGYMAAAGLFGLGLAWILSSFNVFLRDVGQIMGVLLQVWFYLTPVIYPVSQVPERFRTLLALNPMFHVVEGYRWALLSGAAPDAAGVLYLCVTVAAALLAGGAVFERLKPAFADVL